MEPWPHIFRKYSRYHVVTKARLLEGQANRFQIFRVIKAYIAEHDTEPTQEQVSEITGFSRSTVEAHVRALRDSGALRPARVGVARNGIPDLTELLDDEPHYGRDLQAAFKMGAFQ